MNDHMTKTKKELVQMLGRFEEESGVLKLELEALQTLNSETLNEINQLQEDNINLKQRYNEAQKAIDQLKIDGQSAMEQCNASHLASMADSEKRIKNTLLTNQMTEDEKEMLKKELESNRQKISDFEKKSISLFEQINRLKDENISLLSYLSELKEKNGILLGQLNSSKEQSGLLSDQLNKLKKINGMALLENKTLQETIQKYAAICNSEEAIFLLLDKNLDVRFVSDTLKKMLHDNHIWETKPLWDMISGIQEQKYLKKLQSVLIEKKQKKMKNILLKLSPLISIKTEAKMFPATYNSMPAVKVVFNELG